MKRAILKLTAAFALIVTFGIATATAQINQGLRANVPFRFTVGNNALPAGAYQLVMGDQVVRITNGDDQAGIVGLSSRKDATGQPKLVFHKYGDQYFLAESGPILKGSRFAKALRKRN